MFFFAPPSAAQIRVQKQRLEKRLKEEARDWGDDIVWTPRMTIRAKTFTPPSLFKVKPTKHARVSDKIPKTQRVLSPDGMWMYTEMILPRGGMLDCVFGAKHGDICFDGEVIIPRIHQRRQYDNSWGENPWMSITPQEVLTLRCGTRFAKGTTVVAGLGMGHQLEQVCKRKKVKKVIVVERDEGLVEWVKPNLDLNEKNVKFVIGDAKKLIPEMTADAALIDIDTGYGWNTFPSCPNIKKVWVWGSAKLPDRGYW